MRILTIHNRYQYRGGEDESSEAEDNLLRDRGHEVISASRECPGIRYEGRLKAKEVYEMMGAANVVIVPSEWNEIFGRVVVEAFAKGTPALVSNLGAVAELVEPGRTGWQFRAGDAEDLAAKLS
jgi:glycosyltransferase involved in cell wall biosynthesis